MKCPVCDSSAKFLWTKQILKKFEARYHRCDHCGYLFVENPSWLDRAYAQPINIFDTGILVRNLRFSRFVSAFLILKKIRGQFLDYSGGYGIFVRLMRDRGFDFYWNDKYTANLLARGFEQKDKDYNLVTCFEVLEHVINPHDLIHDLSKLAPKFLISTELVPNPLSSDWWYLGPEHGQHIGFHTPKSLKILAEKQNLSVVSSGALHLFSQDPPSRLIFRLIDLFSRVFGDFFCRKSGVSAQQDSSGLRSSEPGL